MLPRVCRHEFTLTRATPDVGWTDWVDLTTLGTEGQIVGITVRESVGSGWGDTCDLYLTDAVSGTPGTVPDEQVAHLKKGVVLTASASACSYQLKSGPASADWYAATVDGLRCAANILTGSGGDGSTELKLVVKVLRYK